MATGVFARKAFGSSFSRWSADDARRVALGIGLAALAIRLAWVAHVLAGNEQLAVFSDSAGYLDPAHSLLDHLRFDMRAGSDTPMWLRTPGYPVFLAAVGGLFGRGLAPILAVQAIVGAVTVIVVHRAALLIAGPRVAMAAALLLAFDPFSVVATGNVLTETVAQLLMALFVWAGVRAMRSSSPQAWLLVGSALAVSTLVRPTTYYLTPLLLVLIAWLVRDRGIGVLRTLLVFMAPTLLLVGGWQVRNAIVVDSAQYTTLDASNLALWRGAAIEYRTGDYASYRDAQLAVVDRVARSVGVTDPDAVDLLRAYAPEGVDQADYWGAMRSEGIRLIRSEPGIYVDETVTGFRNLLFDVHFADEQLGSVFVSTSTVPALRVLLFVEYVVAAIGLFVLTRRGTPVQRRSAWFLVFVLAFVFAASSGPESEERIRTPMLPIVFVFVAAGLDARAIARADP